MKKVLKVLVCILLPVLGLFVGVYLAHAKIEQEKQLLELVANAIEEEMKNDAQEFIEMTKKIVESHEFEEPEAEEADIDLFHEPDWSFGLLEADVAEKGKIIREKYTGEDLWTFREIFDNLLRNESDELGEILNSLLLRTLADY